MTAFRIAFALATSAALVGCGGYVATTPGEQVDVTGKVTVSATKGGSFAGVRVTFQPTAGAGQQVFFALKADGSFAGKMNAGTYTYYLEAAGPNEAVLDKFPKEARIGSMTRTVEVKSGGGELAVNF